MPNAPALALEERMACRVLESSTLHGGDTLVWQMRANVGVCIMRLCTRHHIEVVNSMSATCAVWAGRRTAMLARPATNVALPRYVCSGLSASRCRLATWGYRYAPKPSVNCARASQLLNSARS